MFLEKKKQHKNPNKSIRIWSETSWNFIQLEPTQTKNLKIKRERLEIHEKSLHVCLGDEGGVEYGQKCFFETEL